jgi:hypothetical protein
MSVIGTGGWFGIVTNRFTLIGNGGYWDENPASNIYEYQTFKGMTQDSYITHTFEEKVRHFLFLIASHSVLISIDNGDEIGLSPSSSNIMLSGIEVRLKNSQAGEDAGYCIVGYFDSTRYMLSKN